MRMVAALALAGCSATAGNFAVSIEQPEEVEEAFPLPDDLDTIDWVSVFTDAVNLMVEVNTQAPWLGHTSTMDTRQVGCPDFWTGTFTVGTQTVGADEGISWNDDCITGDELYYDGWLWWDSSVVEEGEADTVQGRTADASRTLRGDAIVGDGDGVRFEFDGIARDTFYNLQAKGYERFVYSTSIDGTVTGSDVFDGSLTPDGYRTDLFMFVTGGDVDTFEARGNAYFFTEQLQGRFDSIQVDMAMVGQNAAAPGDCVLEPLGWIGVRDADAYWYDVVFLPRFEDDVAGEGYDNALSVCDGCGTLYVQGIEQPDRQVCIDFTFLFEDFPLPNPDDYVLPIHAL
ncbi:MAG: hypothetical protein KTR31_04850 [Myxococcales bacterium]|nr:hypothetical protein [Myxococcales bacterium]